MNYLLTCIIISFLFVACDLLDSRPNRELANKKIIAKTICWNPEVYDLILCERQDENSIDNCAYLVNKKRFMKLHSYRFENGLTIQLLSYHSEGPIYYTVEELKNDSLLASSYNFNKQKVLINDNLEIIDLGDTIKKYKVYPSEKLIIVDRTNYKETELTEKECVIYEYQ